jgi:hypothetical protein
MRMESLEHTGERNISNDTVSQFYVATPVRSDFYRELCKPSVVKMFLLLLDATRELQVLS